MTNPKGDRMGQPSAEGEAGPKRPHGTARDRALRLLGVRWRSRDELRRRLGAAGFDPAEVEEALAGLESSGLIDDLRFARELVRDGASRRMAGDRAIRAGLRQKGVASEVAELALAGAGEEAERARGLAVAKAARMASLEPQVAYRRLFGLLVRRGYAPGLAQEACREALRQVPAEADSPGEP